MKKNMIYLGYGVVSLIYVELLFRLMYFTLLSQLPWICFNTSALIWLVKKHHSLE